MTYRGVVKNGVVVLPDDAALPDGTAVDVTPRLDGTTSMADLPAFGIWRDREDMTDSVKTSRQLRQKLEERGGDG